MRYEIREKIPGDLRKVCCAGRKEAGGRRRSRPLQISEVKPQPIQTRKNEGACRESESPNGDFSRIALRVGHQEVDLISRLPAKAVANDESDTCSTLLESALERPPLFTVNATALSLLRQFRSLAGAGIAIGAGLRIVGSHQRQFGSLAGAGIAIGAGLRVVGSHRTERQKLGSEYRSEQHSFNHVLDSLLLEVNNNFRLH